MKNINSKRALVGLDLSEMDEILLRYLSGALEFLDLEKVYFVHVVRKEELSDELLDRLKGMDLKGLVGKRLSQVIDSHFTPDVDTELLVTESDSVVHQMAEWADLHKIGLAIFGKKNIYQGSGAITSNMLRVLHCDQIYVPESAKPKLERILVPIDFSRYTVPLLSRANTFRQRTGAKLQVMHVYRLPRHLFPYIPEKDMTSSALRESQEKIDEYLKKSKVTDVDKLSIPARNKGIVENIEGEAQMRHSDMIIVGSRGKSSLTSLLVGSVTDGLFESDLTMPLLVMKLRETGDSVEKT